MSRPLQKSRLPLSGRQSRHTEQFIVHALRAAKALTISLVAEDEGKIVGHIAFSPVTITDGSENWYGLRPVSVLLRFQGKGIGAKLIREGLLLLKDLGGQGCVLVGHPAYYPRFGFKNDSKLVYEGVPPEVFFALPFYGNVPKGRVLFHEAFQAEI